MYTLRIQHTVKDFDRWKAAFDEDPVGREASGVRHYRIFRVTDGQTSVLIDLDFERTEEAERFLAGLRRVWGQVGDLIGEPGAKVAELVEEHSYAGAP
jgi:hypothetical protein